MGTLAAFPGMAVSLATLLELTVMGEDFSTSSTTLTPSTSMLCAEFLETGLLVFAMVFGPGKGEEIPPSLTMH